MAGRTDIWVYAHWQGMPAPQLMGKLSAQQAKGKKAFGFEYDADWLKTNQRFILDEDINFFSGPQYPSKGKENFGVFLDSMPDTWGRTLMQKRAALEAKETKAKVRTLYDIDFLLGVLDESRMGALRFKLDKEGPFLDNNKEYPTPHWANIRELQEGVKIIESDSVNKNIKKWLSLLMAPGSSLGGARPKANVLDEKGQPWIAKFPSKNDMINKGAWEFLAYRLAIDAGIVMSLSKIEKIAGRHHTFFTKRFDRHINERIHFASAMTMTGNNEDTIKSAPASYLDIADFIHFHGNNIEADLHQLWRRMVFNIFISNTDDHLRNHGFILDNNGWVLAPAFDINPSIDKNGLALNIDMHNNALDIDLAKSVGKYFQLGNKEMDGIIAQVNNSVNKWKAIAVKIGISKSEQDLMEKAFLTN